MTQGLPPDGAPPGQPWWVTGSLVWAVAVSLVLLSVGALAGRPDVALLGVAPLLASLSATWLRPRGQVWADSAQSETTAGVLAQRVQLSAPPGCTAVRLRLGRPEHGFSEVLVHVPLHREIEVTARSVRTGPQQLFRVEHQGIGGGGLTAGPVGEEAPDAVVVLPRSRTMPALPLPSRMRGLTGQHDSRRPPMPWCSTRNSCWGPVRTDRAVTSISRCRGTCTSTSENPCSGRPSRSRTAVQPGGALSCTRCASTPAVVSDWALSAHT